MTESVRNFAAWAHGTQKYGEHPYLKHLDDVAEIVGGIEGLPEYATTVAYLHDVVEDTQLEGADVSRWFGDTVGLCVYMLTDPNGETRQERKTKLHEALGKLDVGAQIDPHLGFSQSGSSAWPRVVLAVKAADRLANVRASTEKGKEGYLKTYQDEHAEFRNAVYRPALCDALWAELDKLLED